MKRQAFGLAALLVVALLAASQRPVAWGRFAGVLATGVLLSVAGLTMARRLGHAPQLTAKRLLLAPPLGAATGGVVLLLILSLVPWIPSLATRLAQRAGKPWWFPFVLATQASVLEEILFRLFLFTMVVWLAARAWRATAEPVRGTWVVAANAISSLAFAAVHLPSWFAMLSSTPLLITAVLVLNLVAGAVMGQIYWRWGIGPAIAAHFAADMVVQSLGPRLVG